MSRLPQPLRILEQSIAQLEAEVRALSRSDSAQRRVLCKYAEKLLAASEAGRTMVSGAAERVVPSGEIQMVGFDVNVSPPVRDAPQRARVPAKKPSLYQLVRKRHRVLIGAARGRYMCVCLDCGKMLGVMSDPHMIEILDRYHACRPTLYGD